jgi:uncharacterized protein YhaN
VTTQSETWPTANTEHGLLVAFGEFLTQHGLLERLSKLPVKQKVGVAGCEGTPQDRLIEFLAGIMSGIEHLVELSDGPHPIANDEVVAQAWGQRHFAHSSSVSRALTACDMETVVAAARAIREFSRPFIEGSVQELLRLGQGIVYDLDLMGVAVSATSRTYQGVAFGWMDDEVKLGYQLARVCLTQADGRRIWLEGFHHAGNTVSVTCLQELLATAESQTGIRPRRRTELVEQRMAAQAEAVNRTGQWLAQQQAQASQFKHTREQLIGKLYHAERVHKQAISPQKTALLETQTRGWRARLPRVEHQQARCEEVMVRHRQDLDAQERKLAELQHWLTQLHRDNATNPDPPAYCEARMDAGFTSGENITWALEMGYCLNTKATSDQTTRALRARTSSETHWVAVGDNADMTAWDNYRLHHCPYPVTVALERFKVGTVYQYATLIYYKEDGQMPTLPAWFAHYNARQTIEAGNKEMKGTFFVQHLMSRSLPAIRLQALFTGVAANAVRWCQPWLRQCACDITPKLRRTLTSPKALVHVAANSAALVQRTATCTALCFAPNSSLSGVTLFLRGIPAFQLSFAFHQPCKIASP